jgi:protein-L-isoaspartate(D-aspartate) O-methyltransferase
MQAAAAPSSASVSPAVLRRTMVDCQLRTFDIVDQRVLEAFETVPRENFVDAAQAALAYSDARLVVGGRALLEPMVLARMLAEAGVKPTDRALDVGGARGYSAAILAELAASVVALEDFAAADVAPPAGARVQRVVGPLDQGWGAGAPYDFILVNGAVETNLAGLLSQLAPGGRMVAVVREPGQTGRASKAIRFDKLASGAVGEKWMFDAAAAPLEPFRRPAAFVF